MLEAIKSVRGCVVAVVVVVATFGVVVTFPFVDWDDALHLTDNVLTERPLAHGWRDLLLTPAFGYPVPFLVLSYAFQRLLFGLNPAGFHAVNLLFHAVNVVLLYALARRLGLKDTAAGAAALLFGIHPVVAEPVSWVTGHKDLLATCLVLVSLLVFVGKRSWKQIVLVSALGIAAVLTKPSAVCVPVLLWIAARTADPNAERKPLALSLAPLSAVTGLLIALGMFGLRSLGAVPTRGWGTAVSDVTGALWMHMTHLVVPTQLLAAYFRRPGDPAIWAMFAAVAIVLGLAYLATRAQRGSLERFGLAFAAIALAPAANVVANWRWVADSYLYLPLVGVAIAVSSFFARVWPAHRRTVGLCLAVIAFGDLALLAHGQARTWSSSVALWQPVADHYPDEVQALAAVAGAYRGEGREADAVRAFVELEERFPDYSDNRDDEAWARMKLGQLDRATMLIERGINEDNPGCIRQFWQALLASPSPPPMEKRDLVANAFDRGFDAMKKGLHRPEPFYRVAEILASLDLGERAKASRDYGKALAGR